MPVFVLDAAALLNNEGFSFDSKNRYFCPFGVMDEWRDFRSKSLSENAAQSEVLTVMDPCPLSIQGVLSFLDENGLRGLSDTDVAVVALATELKAMHPDLVVVTDDFSVQNALKLKKIKFVGVAQGTIKRARRFSKTR
ncbi:MAG: hypothetical protein J4215_01040 [Candidatus Diapherotrites archaeon]|uniref:Ribonuclease PIN domain-containing protein n=1 Tax=Candidatus Iainarchaeum sp. TaxID=3101447 RepID=A0A8T4L6H2_9ARCH|nr:hypothetical protein [Candidatus Diapherotrites archaeon]